MIDTQTWIIFNPDKIIDRAYGKLKYKVIISIWKLSNKLSQKKTDTIRQ